MAAGEAEIGGRWQPVRQTRRHFSECHALPGGWRIVLGIHKSKFIRTYLIRSNGTLPIAYCFQSL
jgi:hypothetical protein